MANTIKAKIYLVVDHQCSLVQELTHPQSRLKTQQLVTDKPGHYQTSHSAHGQFISPSNPHEKEHGCFAKKVSDFLEKEVVKEHYQQIILCADPHFYGLLNQAMSTAIKNLIVKTIEKNYIPLSPVKLNKVIENIIHEPV
jgi:protein required for attachment to host cells